MIRSSQNLFDNLDSIRNFHSVTFTHKYYMNFYSRFVQPFLYQVNKDSDKGLIERSTYQHLASELNACCDIYPPNFNVYTDYENRYLPIFDDSKNNFSTTVFNKRYARDVINYSWATSLHNTTFYRGPGAELNFGGEKFSHLGEFFFTNEEENLIMSCLPFVVYGIKDLQKYSGKYSSLPAVVETIKTYDDTLNGNLNNSNGFENFDNNFKQFFENVCSILIIISSYKTIYTIVEYLIEKTSKIINQYTLDESTLEYHHPKYEATLYLEFVDELISVYDELYSDTQKYYLKPIFKILDIERKNV